MQGRFGGMLDKAKNTAAGIGGQASAMLQVSSDSKNVSSLKVRMSSEKRITEEA